MTGTHRPAFLLAIGATSTAVSLSILAGWQRGGSLAERLAWVAIGVVLVMSAHLLPALVRAWSLVGRGVACLLWIACMATTCYGHATFFLLAQRHAGEQRAAVAVPATGPAPPDRTLTAVMTDRAFVTRQLAFTTARRCPRDCSGLEARRATLAAKLDALEAEANDIRRRQATADRITARHDALLADPVTARLAALLGTTVSRIDLLSGLAFAAVLEGVACLLWTVALRSRPLPPSVAAVMAPVTASRAPEPMSNEPEPDSHMSAGDPVTPSPAAKSSDPDVMQLVQDIAAGRVRPTVAEIRRHLGCSQARAAALRRQLAAHLT
ncbi:putative twin-arginine translocation pathway signal protein [Burkholderia pseudomallei]|uniref:hypothetical protein n=1 Tax=Burkholderia pseudomallei TaxID=28450 RepID=UPI000975C988|nr:hypothetical protein [Burkholderia pseudomallei]ONF11057.1 hypothetical protein AQ960_17610 [Burkholderia pseudomallei]CAJ6979837.1 putative twin-arginine translocation pathway signal protein [Burkholderia pseudomallei]CAJ8269946.1 putative twin-arginine translocation pathway signal protein [Burkholderia pseudomallei]CAJ8332228.1 putative twin-arginine translocation pathway signal protein [Burkholderia pseudomallei]CAJ8811344.1 putative twin-arginine translocation pathway signal protein [Bu